MGLHDDELNSRRERREEMRRKQAQEQKRLKIALISAAVVLVACGAGLIYIAQNAAEGKPAAAQSAESQSTSPATVSCTIWCGSWWVLWWKWAGECGLPNPFPCSLAENGQMRASWPRLRAFA